MCAAQFMRLCRNSSVGAMVRGRRHVDNPPGSLRDPPPFTQGGLRRANYLCNEAESPRRPVSAINGASQFMSEGQFMCAAQFMRLCRNSCADRHNSLIREKLDAFPRVHLMRLRRNSSVGADRIRPPCRGRPPGRPASKTRQRNGKMISSPTVTMNLQGRWYAREARDLPM